MKKPAMLVMILRFQMTRPINGYRSRKACPSVAQDAIDLPRRNACFRFSGRLLCCAVNILHHVEVTYMYAVGTVQTGNRTTCMHADSADTA
jgi:hypothetical protein